MALLTCSSIDGAKFLGCSVVDFSASAGWGAQSSDVTINLVADCEEDFNAPTVGTPITFEMGTFSFTGLVQSWNAKAGSDGNPLYSVKLISPHPILEHAQVILDHYEGEVPFYNIINAYGFLESIGSDCPNNRINGTSFGAPAGGFGDANKTERGIPWKLIKQAVQVLAGGAMGAQYGEYCAGLAFKGDDDGTVNYILDISSLPDANDHYRIAGPVISLTALIDQVCQDGGLDYYITLLPSLQDNTYLIKVVTISRKEEPAIGVEGAQTLGDIAHFIDANNVVNKSLGVELRSEVNSAMVIGGKIKQYYQCVPDPTLTGDAVTPFWGWDADGELITAKLLACDGRDAILHNLTPCAGGWLVKLDVRMINIALANPFPYNFIEVGENELRASLGDYNSFVANILNPKNAAAIEGHGGTAPSDLYNYYTNDVDVVDVRTFGDERPERSDERSATDAKMGVAHDDFSGDPSNAKTRDAKTVYNWLKSYTSDFYGKQFLVYFSLNNVPKLGNICKSTDAFTDEDIYTDVISTDGAWPSETVGGPFGGGFRTAGDVLGLKNPSLNMDRFKDESGKVQAMVKFSGTATGVVGTGLLTKGALNTEGLSLNDYIVVKGLRVANSSSELATFSEPWEIWIKAAVDDKWVEGSPVQSSLPQTVVLNAQGQIVRQDQQLLCALVTLNAPLIDVAKDVDSLFSNRPMDTIQPIGPVVNDQIVDAEGARGLLGGQGESVASLGPALKTDPISMGVPLQSTTNCYGPWHTVGANPGSVLVEVDEGLVPWDCGNVDAMDQAGKAKVQDMATHQQQSERGEITVPGLPTRPLAVNINVADGGGAQRIETIKIGDVVVNFYIYRFNVAPQSSAVISNLSTSVGAGGVTTTYTINTFTPVFGRFSKGNAERLKQIGLNKLKDEREGRARAALKNKIRASEARTRNLANAVVEDMGHPVAPMSPSIWFAGKLDGSDTKRKIVLAPDRKTMVYYDEDAAKTTSVMTMDGFFRPVQTAGGSAANLPKVVSGVAECNGNVPAQSSGPPPPVNTQNPLAISTKFLDILADKNNRTGLFDGRTAGSTSGLGHDIEGVARGTGVNDMWADQEWPGRLLMHSTTGTDPSGVVHDFMDDYRFMALRGPLMIHGWGYDLHGKPIPNVAEGVSAPAFKTDYEDLQDKFKVDWLEDATTWPVAPVDLRFDRKRGVWTVPSAFRLYQITTTAEIAAGATGPASVDKYKDDILDAAGTAISSPAISVENWTASTIPIATRALAYYDTAECQYWIIGGSGGGGGGGTGINVGWTGCDDNDACSPLGDYCLMFGEGLSAARGGGNFTVSGPKIQSGDCAGAGVGEAVSFERLRFVSGLTAVNTDSCNWNIGGPIINTIGCGAPPQPDYGIERLTIGSGLNLLSDPDRPDDNNCWWVIEGPKIANGVIDESFAKLTIGDGLTLTAGDDCNYTLAAEGGGSDIEVGSEGCNNDIPCASLGGDCLVFGAGLQSARDGGKFTVTGPQLSQWPFCAKPQIDNAEFAKLNIGGGLTLAITDIATCEYELTGPKISQDRADDCWGFGENAIPLEELKIGEGLRLIRGACFDKIQGPYIGQAAGVCGLLPAAAIAPVPFAQLNIGEGLRLNDDGNCKYTIEGPKIAGQGGFSLIKGAGDICGPKAAIDPAPFAQLTIGNGLKLIEGVNCQYTLEGCNAKISQDGECGTANINATEFAELAIGKGLNLALTDPGEFIYELTGPKISQTSSDACGGQTANINATEFAELAIGKGLNLSDFGDCKYTIEGPKIVQSSGDACIGGTTTDESFAKLVIGKGLSVDGQGDCSYKISGPKIVQSEDDACIGGATTEESFAKLVIGQGLSVDGQGDCSYKISGPKIADGGAIDESFHKLTIGDGLKLEGDDCNYTLTADGGGGGPSYNWKVDATQAPAFGAPGIVSNGQTVKFVGGVGARLYRSDKPADAPIRTALALVGGGGEYEVTISLEIANKGSYNESVDIPISWDIEGDTLRLFISHEHIEDC